MDFPAPDESSEDFTPPVLAPAGFWVRGGAFLIDILILIPVQILFGLLLNFSGLGSLLTVFYPLLGAAYETWMIGQFGQTLGKMATGVLVVGREGEVVGFTVSFGRYLAKWLSKFTLGMGYLMGAFTPQKRALHDYILSTRVVEVPGTPVWRRRLGQGLGGAFVALPIIFVFSILIGPQWDRPKDLELTSHSRENLSVIRGAIETEKAKTGAYPKKIEPLFDGGTFFPSVRTEAHGEKTSVEYYSDCFKGRDYGENLPDLIDVKDTGGWGYINNPASKCFGHVFIDCSHKNRTAEKWFFF